MQRPFILLLMALAFCRQDLLAQSANAAEYTKHCLYGELLGQGIIYSLNYEHRFINAISGRIGYTSWSFPAIFFLIEGSIELKGFPVMINYLSGKGNHHGEFGLGAFLGKVKISGTEIFWGSTIEGEKAFILGTGTLGYRYQPTTNGLLFKIGLTPIFNFKDAALSAGLSLGYAF